MGWTFPWAVCAVRGTHVCLRKIDYPLIWRLLKEEGITHFNAAPTVNTLLCNSAEAERLPRPVRVTVAASPPTAHLFEQMTKLNLIPVHVYGLTETYGPITRGYVLPEWDALPPHEKYANMARQGHGFLTSLPARVIKPDQPEGVIIDVARDGREIGEIVFSGNICCKGYYRDPEATRKLFAGGVLHTGDLAVWHPDGSIQIQDRAKDIIISGMFSSPPPFSFLFLFFSKYRTRRKRNPTRPNQRISHSRRRKHLVGGARVDAGGAPGRAGGGRRGGAGLALGRAAQGVPDGQAGWRRQRVVVAAAGGRDRVGAQPELHQPLHGPARGRDRPGAAQDQHGQDQEERAARVGQEGHAARRGGRVTVRVRTDVPWYLVSGLGWVVVCCPEGMGGRGCWLVGYIIDRYDYFPGWLACCWIPCLSRSNVSREAC